MINIYRCRGSVRKKFIMTGLLAAFHFYTKKEKYGKLLKKKRTRRDLLLKN